jgi:Reverse transcriptase (RNA-dependent DNA polymerase)
MVDLDVPPTQNELLLAIDMLAREKAPGNDDIPAEVLQADKPALMEPLHSLLCRCWEEGTVPQDLGDVNIVTLYKNKGNRSDCNTYRGILLLGIVSKAFARIILKRLQILAGGSSPNVNVASGQDDFLTKTTAEKKSREHPLYIAFIDMTKAFDLVSRSVLFALLEKIGCPHKIVENVDIISQ